MRVLLTTDTVGGVWTFTRELAEVLLREGHDVALASFGRDPSAHQRAWSKDVFARYGRRFVMSASDSPLEWMPQNQLTFARGERSLVDLCQRFAPDVLHSNQFCWGALSAPLRKVVTAHSDVLSWAQNCRRQLEDCEWLGCYQRLVQHGLDGADVVTAPTAWMAGALCRNFTVEAEVRVIANGRSLEAGTSDEHRLLRAVSAGRLWDEAKGLRTLLDVRSAIPIVVAGETGNEQEIPETPVRFAGVLSEDRVVSLFRGSSVYIVPSVYEPFGLAPLEAALCGCAVVARDLPSLREVWGEAATYFGDAGELELILDAFAANPSQLKVARASSMQRARRFSAEKMAHEYVALYGELLHADRTEEMVANAA
jgi:glycosyltransferase involved in cell wall biosynthesis